jgi:2-polyprenyl-3-methyl-5-hydroxy-6-metoxy-1,4-benzoquinol methylase
MNNNSDWHLQTQNGDYLDLSVKRLSSPILNWVEQITDLINENLENINKKDIRINDIGCNVGHFYRNIDQINSKVTYTGFDISDTYLDVARSHFPEANFVHEDVGSKRFDITKYECDISVISATLEHIEDYEQFLKNIFESTKSSVILRTFIGEKSLKDYCLKPGASQSYLIRQFKFEDLRDKSFNLDWADEVIEDKATDNKEKEVCKNILRTQKIINFKNNERSLT